MMSCDPSAFDGMALSPGIIRRLQASGLSIVACRWRYGDIALRKKPFPEHIANAGELTTIDGRVGDGWDGTGWFPGDHDGCLCRLVPIFGRGAPVTVVP